MCWLIQRYRRTAARCGSIPTAVFFAHVVGYSDQGKAGLESEMNFELLTSNAFFLEKLRNEFQDQKNTGDTVVTTLDVELQQAASDALGGNKGAVVVMEPDTGKILAMVSKPDLIRELSLRTGRRSIQIRTVRF